MTKIGVKQIWCDKNWCKKVDPIISIGNLITWVENLSEMPFLFSPKCKKKKYKNNLSSNCFLKTRDQKKDNFNGTA